MDYSKEVLNYINSNEYLGAFLLTGKWGSGKTHSIKQIVNSINNEENYYLLMVSVFGISSTNEIERLVKKQLLLSAVGDSKKRLITIGSKGLGALNKVSALLKDYSNVFKGINTALSFDYLDLFPIQSDYFDDKKLVIVFDDFERTDC